MLRAACLLAGVSLVLASAGGATVRSAGRIAFSAGSAPAGGGIITSQIYVANADGSGRTKLTTGGDNSYPALSPDGTTIAFTSDRGGNYELYVMAVDGSNPLLVKTGVTGLSSPAWSPDGSRIAFTWSKGEAHDTYVVAAGGGDAKVVQQNAIGPAWSPDGSKLAFSGSSDNRLYWSSGASGARHRVIARSGLGYEQSPSWSPDGKKLVFTGDVADHPQVYVVGIDGSGLKKLTSGASHASYPRFTADGSKIVYGDGGKLLQMSANGGGATTLATVGGEITGLSLWGAASGGTSKGSSGGGTRNNPHHCTIFAPKKHAPELQVNGTPGDDVICGSEQMDGIHGKGGNDIIYGGGGDDVLVGGPGRDTLYGEAGNDRLWTNDDGRLPARDISDGGPGKDSARADKIDVLRSIEEPYYP